ncbi:cell division protein FtsQ/DivIB [Celeribacter arenosi]|uniref:Cell division protein FtsQ n=1 Tax=Celeribacter arenosi TaxID=792649 RepID=A0ABP7JU81_9RHOB
MRPVDHDQFVAAPAPGGSARVSEAVARALRARTSSSASPRRDPAPSRVAYRMSRLWLTPSFRFFLRRVAPVLVVAAVAGAYFSVEENRRAITDTYMQVKGEVQNRPEFMVKLMAIDGASEELSHDIREVVPIDFPLSSFDLDLPGMLEQIESLDAVSQAHLRVRAGGILQVDITERVPAVVWRGPHGLELLDPAGHRVSALDMRQDRQDLPLIAGVGADRYVGEALSLITAARPILSRVRGLVRVGERRWDMVLDRDQIIQLPETAPAAALAQVIALESAKELLARDVRAVDMRNPERPTLRLNPEAQADMQRIKGLERGVSMQ